MARVTLETVDRLARLARLSLTPEERETFARQLDEVLAYAESIQGVATQDVPPMSHALTGGALREDVPEPSLERARALVPAPDAADGLFRVPRILGG
jgi:aspartyl-tRNA(Asn)/glutamyl-tRNA(Gln) amidotransferase subunit C